MVDGWSIPPKPILIFSYNFICIWSHSCWKHFWENCIWSIQKYVERNRECYHIIIFPERTWHFTSRKKRKTIVMEHFNDILSHNSRSANKQHTNHSLAQKWNSSAIIKIHFIDLSGFLPFLGQLLLVPNEYNQFMCIFIKFTSKSLN
jgi:hypothetical protein